MLRRKPTRLELKMDDTEEFESIKKELESRKRQRDEVSVASGAGPAAVGGEGGGASDDGPRPSRTELAHERIGYKPNPKPTTLPAMFGNLQF